MPHAPTPTAEPTPPDAGVWQALAEADDNALAWLDAAGRVRWHNAAFAAIAGGVGARAAAHAHAGAKAMELAAPDEHGQPHRWRLRATRLADGSIALMLRDVRDSAERLAAENARLRELLDMAQECGRLGVWERDPHTLEGRWDRHVFRFFGIEAGHDETPDFALAARRVHPADRLDDAFRASIALPGSYSGRYRVLHADGSVRHIHSQWRVLADARGEPVRVIGVMVDDTDARELARAAEAAHAQLDLILSLGNIGTWRYDVASGRMHHDARIQSALGRTMGDEGVPIQSIRDLVHPDDRAQMDAAFAETLASGRPTDSQARYLHADGSWRVLLIRRVLQTDAHGRPFAVLGVGMDISALQARREQALQQGLRLEAVAEAARLGLWSGALDSSAGEWNAHMYALAGLDPAQGPLSFGDWLRRCVHADDRDQTAAQVVAWLKSAPPASLQREFRVVWPDGSTHWLQMRAKMDLDANGQHRAFGVLIDITEQRETLRQLREAHERATLAMGSVGMGTWYHDLATGKDDWDAQMFALRGVAPAERAPDAQGRSAYVHPDDRARVAATVQTYDAGAEPLSHEFRVVWPDGSVHWLASRSVALLDEHGHVVRRIGVNWDVTETKLLERAQRERELALRENRAKSQFLARMSHELRTPLNAVLGFSQLLLTEGPGGDARARQDKLTRIHTAGQQLLSLIDSLLELSDSQGHGGGDAPAPAPGVVAGAAADLGPAPPRVLYVEDNEVNMLLVRELLKQRPHLEFHGAIDCASGVALARQLRPALVLIDMQLPDGDGMDVLRQLRADPATAQLTCVALSANAMPEDAQRARAAGFADYWTKPIDLGAFLQGLDRLVPGEAVAVRSLS